MVRVLYVLEFEHEQRAPINRIKIGWQVAVLQLKLNSALRAAIHLESSTSGSSPLVYHPQAYIFGCEQPKYILDAGRSKRSCNILGLWLVLLSPLVETHAHPMFIRQLLCS